MQRTEPPDQLIYERPRLTGYQRSALFCAARYGVVEATTKAGKTAGAMAWLIEQALDGRDGWNYWWIGPVSQQADMVFRRYKRGLPHDLFEARESPTPQLTLPNGAVLRFKSGDKPDSLYGEDVYAAVIDEASRVREESWHAIRSTLTATRGPVRIIGNVKGRRNWAYQLARQAESGAPDMHYARITAYDAIRAGIVDAAEIEDARQKMPEAVFRELYLAEPSDDQGNPFGLAAIRLCVGDLSPLAPVVWGVDLAKSQDWLVALALDAHGAVCRFERWQAPWEISLPRVVALVGQTPAYVDSTGAGDPVLEMIQRSCRNAEGYHFTAPSKQQLMESLAVAIQQREVVFPDGPIRQELETFEFVYTRSGVHYAAMTGLHDDCVDALALAVLCRRRLPVRRPYQPAVSAPNPLMLPTAPW